MEWNKRFPSVYDRRSITDRIIIVDFTYLHTRGPMRPCYCTRFASRTMWYYSQHMHSEHYDRARDRTFERIYRYSNYPTVIIGWEILLSTKRGLLQIKIRILKIRIAKSLNGSYCIAMPYEMLTTLSDSMCRQHDIPSKSWTILLMAMHYALAYLRKFSRTLLYIQDLRVNRNQYGFIQDTRNHLPYRMVKNDGNSKIPWLSSISHET